MNTGKSYLYDKETCELVVVLNYSPEEFKQHTDWYTEWREGLIIEDHEFAHPKLSATRDKMEEKTRVELVQEGLEELNDGEYIEDGVIIQVDPDSELIKPKWNAEKHVWEESATEDEIAEALFNARVSFYNAELEFANKALTELNCETISTEQFEEVKVYIQSIDPYAVQEEPVAAASTRVRRAALVEEEQPSVLDKAITEYENFETAKTKRPSIFDRYDRNAHRENYGIDVNKVIPKK